MNYDDAKLYLHSLEKLGSIPGTETIRELLFRVHNPQKQLQVIHIAGTNGKGSVGAFLESILLQTGATVGRYASPAVFEELEIISVNRQAISEENFASYVERVGRANDRMVLEGLPSATRFEVETVVALLYFAEQNLDYVLVECGMGGLLDATNVFEKPLLCVITNISYDHMSFLGSTLAEIATQKSGIMKNGCTCVATHSCEESDEALSMYANQIGAKLVWAENCLEWISIDKNGLHCTHPNYGNLTLGLTGAYQLQNASLAIRAVEVILPSLSGDILQAGLQDVVWPGRFQIIHERPTVILDGAHNPDGMEGLRNSLMQHFPNQKVICVMGVFSDKDYAKELSIILDCVREFVCIETPNHPRALPAKKLAEMIHLHYDVPVCDFDNLQNAFTYVKEIASEEDVVVCCGSLSHLKYIQQIIKSWE